MKITIIDVFRKLGLSPDKEQTWAIGAAVRDHYIARYGEPPEKALREKTNGGGSHCFAQYPQEMEPAIAKIIALHQIDRDAQGDLFR